MSATFNNTTKMSVKAQVKAAAECIKAPMRYRRATTTKAPRKRTFIANMTKYTLEDLHTGNLQLGPAVCKAACSPVQLSNDDGAGGNGPIAPTRPFRGDGNDNNNSNNNNNNGSNSWFISSPILTAAALAVALTLMAGTPNAQANPMNTPAPAPSTAQCLCLNVRRRVAKKGSREGDAIPYGQVQLSDLERKMVACPQTRFKESVRVY